MEMRTIPLILLCSTFYCSAQVCPFSPFAPGVTRSGTATNGLVRHYKFDEDTGTTSASLVPAENVNATGISLWTSAGHTGAGVAPNGFLCGADLGDAASINFGSGDFTYYIWANSSTATTAGFLISHEDDDVAGRYLYRNASDQVVFSCRDTGGDMAVVTSTTTIDSTWRLFVGVRSGSTFTLYVGSDASAAVSEGTPVTNPAVGSTDPVTGNCKVGCRDAISVGAYTGKLDDTRVFNEAKTLTDINALRVSDAPP